MYHINELSYNHSFMLVNSMHYLSTFFVDSSYLSLLLDNRSLSSILFFAFYLSAVYQFFFQFIEIINNQKMNSKSFIGLQLILLTFEI